MYMYELFSFLQSEAPPQLQNDPDNKCHYIINWNTKVACKQKTEESDSCVVEDPQAGIQYNFNPLAKKMSVSLYCMNFYVIVEIHVCLHGHIHNIHVHVHVCP